MADLKEKTYVEDVDRSVYDIRDEENDAYRMESGLTPEIVEKLSKEKDDPAASDTTAQTQAPATSGDTNAPGGDVTTAATEPSTDTPSKDTEPPEKQKPDIRLDDDGKTEWDSYIPVN